MQMAAFANLPATNSFIQLKIYRAPFPLHAGTVVQGNAENQQKTLQPQGNTGKQADGQKEI